MIDERVIKKEIVFFCVLFLCTDWPAIVLWRAAASLKGQCGYRSCTSLTGYLFRCFFFVAFFFWQ